MDEILNTTKVAARLGIQRQYVFYLIRKGRLKAHKVGREWAIYATDVAMVKLRRYIRVTPSLPRHDDPQP